jgi:acetamidase/formamidase
MKHVLDRSLTCNRWNRDYSPVLTVASGDSVSIAMKDSSDGQVRPDMTSAEFARIDATRIHALTGPIAIEGAEPGDALEIEVLEFQHEGWGWTGIIPPMGLLGDEFG